MITAEMHPTDYITELRTLIGNAPVNLMGAAGLIFDAEGRVLLQRLTERNDVWSLPGGLCKLAEAPEQTLKREIYEETTLQVHEAELIALLTTPLRTLANGHQASFYTALYCVTDWSGIPTPDGKESAQVEWFHVQDLPPIRGLVGQWASKWLQEHH